MTAQMFKKHSRDVPEMFDISGMIYKYNKQVHLSAVEKLSMAGRTSDISMDTNCNVTKIKRHRHARKVPLSGEEKNCESDSEVSINTYFLFPYHHKNGKKSASNILFKNMCDRIRHN